MHTISRDDVMHIAHLARIRLTAKEVEKFAHELSHILEYVQQLQGADTRGVAPTVHATGAVNVFRNDVAHAQTTETRSALLQAVPEREGDLVKVKAVFTNE